jgi:hypothetical protein
MSPLGNPTLSSFSLSLGDETTQIVEGFALNSRRKTSVICLTFADPTDTIKNSR